MTEIVGRDVELAAVRELMGRGGRSALLLEGDPGIGKSTLWLAGIEAAEQHGHRVLLARPAEAEAQLALAGLGDLLEPCADEVLPRLTSPQRRALEVALVLADPDDEDHAVPDPRALGVAVRSALRLLAEEATLVVAIDDVQWLDRTSAGALGFAVRRLDGAGVRLLLTRRGAPSAVEAALAGGRTDVLRVEPLSVGAVHGLLRNTLGRTFPRPTLRRLHEASGGNPLYALELARALGEGTARGSLDPLPLTPSLERLVDARLRTLPRSTRAGLLVAAVVGSPTTELLEAAGVPAEALAPAVEAEVVEVRAGVVRFAHPLLASETVARASPAQRTEAHRRVADVIDEPLARAVHVAASLEGPDAEAADELDRAVRTARARGATALAAELGEAAMRATPAEQAEERGRRARAAARDHLASGESERGFALARALLADGPAGRARADVLALLGDLEAQAGELEVAVERRREALWAADGDLALQSRLHEQLAYVVRITESLVVAVTHAQEALRLAERVADDTLTARALGTLSVLLCNSGDPDSLDLAERGLGLARRSGDQDTVQYAAQSAGHCLYWSGHTAQAREVFTEMVRLVEDRDEPGTVNALWYLALVEERAGRYDVARRHAQRSMELAAQYWLPGADYDPVVALPLARVALARGDHDRVRELTAAVLAGDEPPRRSTDRSLLAMLAMVDRREGRTAEAVARFESVEAGQRAAGFSRGMAFWADEYVEALLEAGRPDEAAALVDDWDGQVRRLGHLLAPAQVLRCRGMLAAAAGDLEAAAATFAAAVAAHEPVVDPYERGRALLALGQASRRLKQKRAAREALEAAAAQFAGIGATWWADRARSELGSVGGRTRIEGLTPAERRVAALVAEGKTNREVASTLFLGESTVEKHLTHIYAKLGVRSRTELARALT